MSLVDATAVSARGEDSVDLAYRALRRSILAGHLSPGATLSQVSIAHQLGISRTPLREAVNRLVGEGLVTTDFNRRMRVSELDPSDLDQIYAARLALEPLGVRATIARLGPADQANLAARVEAMDAAIERCDMEAFREDHRAFHLGLTALSGRRMSRMLGDLWDHSERYRLRYLQWDRDRTDPTLRERLLLSQVEHRHMLAAAVGGEAKECARLLVAHLTRTLDSVYAEMAEVPAPRLSRLAMQPTRT
jgi:DNA-binding GntR family transcriptional regulator